MSTRTTAQKSARQLQRLAEDELGIRPRLTKCHDILRVTPRDPSISREEFLTMVFLANRDALKASAERREAAKTSESDGETK